MIEERRGNLFLPLGAPFWGRRGKVFRGNERFIGHHVGNARGGAKRVIIVAAFPLMSSVRSSGFDSLTPLFELDRIRPALQRASDFVLSLSLIHQSHRLQRRCYLNVFPAIQSLEKLQRIAEESFGSRILAPFGVELRQMNEGTTFEMENIQVIDMTRILSFVFSPKVE